MVSLALDELKSTYGDRLRIMTAGAWARPEDLGRGIDHLGLLDYRSTGDLYRRADIGISLTVSPHPSYLPVELMACGAAVVAFDLPPGYWILRDGEDCVLARRTVPSLVAAVSKLIDDPAHRRRIQAGGREIVRRNLSDEQRAARPVVSPAALLRARDVLQHVYMDEKIEQYILDIVFATRFPQDYGLAKLKPLISYGGSPRASINLSLAAKAHAFMQKRGFVVPDDVRAICKDVMRHRIGITYEAEAENANTESIIDTILQTVPVP